MRARRWSAGWAAVGFLLAGLLAFLGSPAAVAADEVPVLPPGEVSFGIVGLARLQVARLNVVAVGGGSPDPSEMPFGMVGLARLQTARLNLVAVGGGSPDPSTCPVEVSFVDETGAPFLDTSGTPIAARFMLAPGEARELDLRAADAFRRATGLRVAIRAVVHVAVPSNPCRPPAATLEVFDTLTGRTSVLYVPTQPGE